MAQSESTSALVRIFIGRLLHHWAALATGGGIMAAVWAANSLAGWQIPWGVNLVLAISFFGIAAFQTWREEHLKLNALESEPLRPIQIRKRLDDFVERGRELLGEWKSGRGLPPQTQTELWDSSL